jgi:hypothetical protein
MTTEELQNVSCLWPHCLQANFTRVPPFCAETRFGAPHLPQVASMRVLPCLTTMALRAMVSRIRRSAYSPIDCFDIRLHLSWRPPQMQPYTLLAHLATSPVAKKLLLKPHHSSGQFGFNFGSFCCEIFKSGYIRNGERPSRARRGQIVSDFKFNRSRRVE